MSLYVCSPSTLKYIPKNVKSICVTAPPSEEILSLEKKYSDVIAIGGGSVVDTAKIICYNRAKVTPTTFSGATETSHAVAWIQNKKIDVVTAIPKLNVRMDYLKATPQEVLDSSGLVVAFHF